MGVLGDVLRLSLAIGIAFVAGKLISKLKLPSILGWLIAGMIIGPHAVNLLGSSVLDAQWFDILESIFECTFGLMIGTELIWKQMKKAGPQILVTTITESLGTFLVVSLVFGIIFWFAKHSDLSGLPVWRDRPGHGACPSLSVVNEFKNRRPGDQNADPHGGPG